MNPQPSLLYAESYIKIHASHTGPGFHGSPTGPFVTVSRETGTGVTEFTNTLAKQLDQRLPGRKPWTVFDRNLVETMLSSRGLSPFLASLLPEDKVSEIQSSFGEITGIHPSLWELTHLTNEMMRQLAQAGHVILVGRGANFATDRIEHGLHLRLVGSKDYRAEFKARELNVSVDEAMTRNLQTDNARRKYVRSVFGADVETPQAYDLVINVARMPTATWVDLIVELVVAQVPVTAD
ncbi:MAG: cytidylate kinase-like family protein [Cephaloticoccus sp.]|nr:cytidylate kinase-like family protein [Cephaloticoccus sp.]